MAEKTNETSPNATKNNNNVVNNSSSYLETTKSERHVWLMKCPALVSRSFRQNQEQMAASQVLLPPFLSDNSSSSSVGPVAKVVVAIDPLRPNDEFSSTQFTMELANTGSSNGLNCFTMDMSKDFIPMSLFSESAKGKVSAEGKIDHKFDMKPHTKTLEDYGKFCRERTNKSMTKTRQIQVIDGDSGQHLRPVPGLISIKSSGSLERKKTLAKGSETKRTRRNQDEMEVIMFKLFEREPKWTLKQLIEETDQPEQFLKDMLKLLCVYNNKGSNQGTYELKPEYKSPKHDSDSK